VEKPRFLYMFGVKGVSGYKTMFQISMGVIFFDFFCSPAEGKAL